MNMVIVERELRGQKQWAIRKGWFFHTYATLEGSEYWWKTSEFIEWNAWAGSYEKAKVRFEQLKPPRITSPERVVFP